MITLLQVNQHDAAGATALTVGILILVIGYSFYRLSIWIRKDKAVHDNLPRVPQNYGRIVNAKLDADFEETILEEKYHDENSYS